MIVFLDYLVGGFIVPPVQGELPQNSTTAFMHQDPSVLDQGCSPADPRQHLIVSFPHGESAVPADALDEAGSGRVHDHMLDRPVSRQLLQGSVVLLIRPHGSLLFAIIVVFCHTDGISWAYCPQPGGKRVDGAVVDGDVPLHVLGKSDIMASLAQQESQSLSQNVKLGLQFRYQNGQVQVNHNHFLGYTKDDEGNLIIDPEQAEVVKRIYREYLEGYSMDKIAKGLEADVILTGAGKTKWWTSTINIILRNEKYIGDALLQKTYTTDFLNKTRVKNNGIVPATSFSLGSVLLAFSTISATFSATEEFPEPEADVGLRVFPEPLPLIEDIAFATPPIATPTISSDSTGCSAINLPTDFNPLTNILFAFLGTST